MHPLSTLHWVLPMPDLRSTSYRTTDRTNFCFDWSISSYWTTDRANFCFDWSISSYRTTGCIYSSFDWPVCCYGISDNTCVLSGWTFCCFLSGWLLVFLCNQRLLSFMLSQQFLDYQQRASLSTRWKFVVILWCFLLFMVLCIICFVMVLLWFPTSLLCDVRWIMIGCFLKIRMLTGINLSFMRENKKCLVTTTFNGLIINSTVSKIALLSTRFTQYNRH